MNISKATIVTLLGSTLPESIDTSVNSGPVSLVQSLENTQTTVFHHLFPHTDSIPSFSLLVTNNELLLIRFAHIKI